MKKLTLALVVTAAFSTPVTATAADYSLKRVLVTWEDGILSDSAQGDFSAEGKMSVIGNRITQNMTLCLAGACEAAHASATILSVAPGASSVRIRNDNGLVQDMALLSLSPTIITTHTYSDGTVEIGEWTPALSFIRNEAPEGAELREGLIGAGAKL